MISLFEMKRLLHPADEAEPVDDFRILDSWAEYEDNPKKSPDEQSMSYLCYYIETMNPKTGERVRFYKAICLLRVIRIPEGAKESTTFMNMQGEVLSAAYENDYNLITVICNMREPALGLLFLYGTQATHATSIETAKEKAREAFLGYYTALIGAFRVIEMRRITAEEAEWLRTKMYNMDYMTVVRGIPKATQAGEDAGNKGLGGHNLNPGSEGTLEKIIAGMSDFEYVIEIISSPVPTDTLLGWKNKSQEEMTKWNSQLQGTKAISANISLPIMYMANASQSQGWSKGFTDSSTSSTSTGETFTTGESQSVGQSLSQTLGRTVGHTQGTSISNSLSQGVTNTSGITTGETLGQTYGMTHGYTNGTSQGVSVNNGQSLNVGSSTNQGASYTEGMSQNQSVSQNASLSQGTNVSTSHGITEGSSYNVSQGQNVSSSHSLGHSQNLGWTESQNSSLNNGYSHNVSQTDGLSKNLTDSYSDGISKSAGLSKTVSANAGYNEGETWGTNVGFNLGVSGGISSSNTASSSFGLNAGASSSSNLGSNFSHSMGGSSGSTTSVGNTYGETGSMGYGQSVGSSGSYGVNESYSTSEGQSLSQGWGTSASQSLTSSTGQSVSLSNSLGSTTGNGASQSLGQTISSGNTLSAGQTASTGQSYGISSSESLSSSQSNSYSQSLSQSRSVSESQTVGKTFGQSLSESSSESASTGYGQTTTQSQSVSNGNSYSTSNGTSKGTNTGSSGTSTLGTSSSMGISAGIGYNKSYQWLDQGVKDLLELLEYQNERLKKSLRGQGAFYTYAYVACGTKDGLSAVKAVAKSTWQNNESMVQPVQVLDLTETEQKHLLYHFAAFSGDITRTNENGVDEAKYRTVLLPEEYAAYTHVPRIGEGGVYTTVQDIPKFAAPSMMKGEIYMGTILNTTRYSFENGYRTPYDYKVDESMLMHGYFTGASRSGKTVAAMRFVAELTRVKRKKTGKPLRVVVMDPKQDWRGLARFVESERFNFYSMGKIQLGLSPMHLNIWKVPLHVSPQIWIDGIIDIYCRAYGLLERGKQMIADVVYELYSNVDGKGTNLFHCQDDEEIHRLSGMVDFKRIYRRFEEKQADLAGNRSGNDTKDAYARLLERLSCFSREFSIESRLYGGSSYYVDTTTEVEDPKTHEKTMVPTKEFHVGTGATAIDCISKEEVKWMGVDDLIGGCDVTVMESKGLENTFKNFIFGAITSGFYKFAMAHDGGFLAEDQYETVLVIEEANEVLTGNDTAGGQGGQSASLSGQSEFEQILDQSAGYGLFIIAITQKIADMPSSVIANSGLVFAGKLKRPDDINVVVRAVGREERMDDRDLVKWFPRAGIGQFVCQASRAFNFKDAEPVLVQIAPLDLVPLSNAELSYTVLESNLAKGFKSEVYRKVQKYKKIKLHTFDKLYRKVREEWEGNSEDEITNRIIEILKDNPFYD